MCVVGPFPPLATHLPQSVYTCVENDDRLQKRHGLEEHHCLHEHKSLQEHPGFRGLEEHHGVEGHHPACGYPQNFGGRGHTYMP